MEVAHLAIINNIRGLLKLESILLSRFEEKSQESFFRIRK